MRVSGVIEQREEDPSFAASASAIKYAVNRGDFEVIVDGATIKSIENSWSSGESGKVEQDKKYIECLHFVVWKQSEETGAS